MSIVASRSVLMVALFLLQPLYLLAQTRRFEYCQNHPTDSSRCKAIAATDAKGHNVTLGVPLLCGSESPSTDSLLTFLGLDEDTYESAGLCKLSHAEVTNLLRWSMSQKAERIYYPQAKRADKHIYVHLEIDGPTVFASDVRSALRAKQDIELVDDVNADFFMWVGVLAAKMSNGIVGYSSIYQTYSRWELHEPPQPPVLVLEGEPLLEQCGNDNIETSVNDAIASADVNAFESFRKFWPYLSAR